jgi:hypothetical protein
MTVLPKFNYVTARLSIRNGFSSYYRPQLQGARRLQPLDINCDINTAIGILQDIDGMILLMRTV